MPLSPQAVSAAPVPWTIDDARALYNVEGWGSGYFDVNAKGHVVVRPDREHPEREVDLCGHCSQAGLFPHCSAPADLAARLAACISGSNLIGVPSRA